MEAKSEANAWSECEEGERRRRAEKREEDGAPTSHHIPLTRIASTRM